MKLKKRLIRKRRWGQVTTWVALFLFMIAATPLPLLVSQHSLDDVTSASFSTAAASTAATDEEEEDIPYPCQGGTCGCRSAKKCWTSCCCLSPRQREAWAKAQGIKPPEYAVLASEHSDLAGKTPQKKSCCAPKSAPKVAPLQAHSSGCCDQASTRPKKIRSNLIILIDVAKCSGLSFDMTSLSAFVLPSLTAIPSPLSSRDIKRFAPAVLPAALADVPTPPPRD